MGRQATRWRWPSPKQDKAYVPMGLPLSRPPGGRGRCGKRLAHWPFREASGSAERGRRGTPSRRARHGFFVRECQRAWRYQQARASRHRRRSRNFRRPSAVRRCTTSRPLWRVDSSSEWRWSPTRALQPQRAAATAYSDYPGGGERESAGAGLLGNQTIAMLACHRPAGEGGTVGPKLDGIGSRTRREYRIECHPSHPNAKIAAGFRKLAPHVRRRPLAQKKTKNQAR